MSILYADIVNFTPLSETLSAHHLVSTLNRLFGRFDQLAQVAVGRPNQITQVEIGRFNQLAQVEI